MIYTPPVGHFHRSIRSCGPCLKAARALYSKRWYLSLTTADYDRITAAARSRRRLLYARRVIATRTCPICDSPLEKGHRLCTRCAKEAAEWRNTKYNSTHKVQIQARRRARNQARGFTRTDAQKEKRRLYEKRKQAERAEKRGDKKLNVAL